MLDSQPSAVIAFCQSIFIDEYGEEGNSYNENYKFIYKTDRWESNFVASGEEECSKYMIRHNSIPNASAALFRTEAFLKAGGPPVTWKLNGDWMFYCQLFRLGGVAYCAEPLNRFRKHSETQRQRANANARAYFEILDLADYISEYYTPNADIRKESYGRYADWWVGSLFRQKLNSTYLRDNARLYRRFRKHRSVLLLRIIYVGLFTSTVKLIEFTGLKPFLKSIRNAILPDKFFPY
jgi:hypothetical protein